MTRTALITGVAGFIGYHLAEALLSAGWDVVGIDDLNRYYPRELKNERIALLREYPNFRKFFHWDCSDQPVMHQLINEWKPEVVFHLAAQAGVRYSIANPKAYVQANCQGHLSVMEACCKNSHIVKQFIYASSSSVYGNRPQGDQGFKESEVGPGSRVISPYAATKLSNEMMAECFASLYPNLRMTGLRFFTVYGPLGRPDMAYWTFARDIIEETPIRVFGEGTVSRDFTYVTDIVRAMTMLIDADYVPFGETGTGQHEVLNIGAGKPHSVGEFIDIIEQCVDKVAVREMVPMQPGDVVSTHANTNQLRDRIPDWKPEVSLADGLRLFTDWFVAYRERVPQTPVPGVPSSIVSF